MAKRYTDNDEAYDSYLRGLWIKNNKEGEEERKMAIMLFESAIELDPNFSLAHFGVADTYLALLEGKRISTNEALPKIKKALQQALKIDETLTEAIALSKMLKFRFMWDWAGGELDIKKALKLDPNSSYARLKHGTILMAQGKFEKSIEENLIALELDPLSSRTRTIFAAVLYHARKYDEAIEECKKLIEHDPDLIWPYELLGYSYAQQSSFVKSISAYKKAAENSGNSTQNLSSLAYGYAMSDNSEKAVELLKELEQLSKNKYVSDYYIAHVFTALDQKDKAFEFLERGYKNRDPAMWKLKIDPTFDALRSDPRYEAMLEKIGLMR